jgi:hypothetical protein
MQLFGFAALRPYQCSVSEVQHNFVFVHALRVLSRLYFESRAY